MDRQNRHDIRIVKFNDNFGIRQPLENVNNMWTECIQDVNSFDGIVIDSLQCYCHPKLSITKLDCSV